MAPRNRKAATATATAAPKSSAPATAPARSTRAAKASINLKPNPNQPAPSARTTRGKAAAAAAPVKEKTKRVPSKKRIAQQEEQAADEEEQEQEVNTALPEEDNNEQQQQRGGDSAQSSTDESEVEMDIQRLLTSPARGGGGGGGAEATDSGEEEEEPVRSLAKGKQQKQKKNIIKFKKDKNRKGPPGRRESKPQPRAEPSPEAEQSSSSSSEEEEDRPRPTPMPPWDPSQLRAPSPSQRRRDSVDSEDDEDDEDDHEDLDRPDNEDRPKIFMHADARGENWRQDRMWLYPEFGGEGEREQLVKDIERNGGKIIKKPNAGCYAIFPRGDLEAFRPEIEQARATGAHPIAQLWLEESLKATRSRSRSGTPLHWRCRPQMYQIELPQRRRKQRVDFSAREKDTLAKEMLKMRRKWNWDAVDERAACRRAMEKHPKTHELETWVRHLRHYRAEYEDRMRRLQRRRDMRGRGVDQDSSDEESQEGSSSDEESREQERKRAKREKRRRAAAELEGEEESDRESRGGGEAEEEEEDLPTSREMLRAAPNDKGKKRARGTESVEVEMEEPQPQRKKAKKVVERMSPKKLPTAAAPSLTDPLTHLSTLFPSLPTHHLRGIYYYTSFSLPLSTSCCSLLLQGQSPAILWSPEEDQKIMRRGKEAELEGREEEVVRARWRFLRGCERVKRGNRGAEEETVWHPSLEED